MPNTITICYFCEEPDCDFRGRPEYRPLKEEKLNEQDNKDTD